MDKNKRTQDILNNNPFLALLAQLDAGRVVSAAADKYPMLIEAVHLTGKKGTITIRLDVVPEGSGEVRAVAVRGKITTALPEKDLRETLFFVTEDMRLQRDDPNQGTLEAVDRALEEAEKKQHARAAA